jgi:single-stranded DNA-specific DHH superfamily exonuclease
MAEYGEWNRKGATLSDVSAQKEYGISRDFIIQGINAGKLEFREGSIWGNPYLRILRRQLEAYMAEELGTEHVFSAKAQTELRQIKKQINELKKKLQLLQLRKAELEKSQGLAVKRRC